MKKLFLAVAAAGVVVVAATAALTGCGNSSNDQTAQSTTAPAGVTGTAAHDQADVLFAQQMIPHHAQAIEMSDILLAKQGIDPRVTELATQIKAAQGPEIEQMQGWLQEWGASSSPAPAPATSTAMPGHDMPAHQMPSGDMGKMPGMGGSGHGMMSEAVMAALQNAQGAEASRLFLTQMIAHHKGAIMMAQQEIDNGQFRYTATVNP